MHPPRLLARPSTLPQRRVYILQHAVVVLLIPGIVLRTARRMLVVQKLGEPRLFDTYNVPFSRIESKEIFSRNSNCANNLGCRGRGGNYYLVMRVKYRRFHLGLPALHALASERAVRARDHNWNRSQRCHWHVHVQSTGGRRQAGTGSGGQRTARCIAIMSESRAAHAL